MTGDPMRYESPLRVAQAQSTRDAVLAAATKSRFDEVGHVPAHVE